MFVFTHLCVRSNCIFKVVQIGSINKIDRNSEASNDLRKKAICATVNIIARN